MTSAAATRSGGGARPARGRWRDGIFEPPIRGAWGGPAPGRRHDAGAGDPRVAIQSALGLLWLLDACLQLQPFMFSRRFLAGIAGNAYGQPGWLTDSITWAAHLAGRDLGAFNAMFAITQLLLGLGLLYHRTVKAALAASLAWTLIVWWFGEGFGMLFTNAASPLTGAPGAVVLYALVAMIAWPTERLGGLLGARGARTAWATVWLVMGWLWLMDVSTSANATSDAIAAAPSGIAALDSIRHWVADLTAGSGLLIAFTMALTSATVGVGVAAGWHARPLLAVSVPLSIIYWVLVQGLGGLFTGSATDPSTAPPMALLAVALYPLVGSEARGRTQHSQDACARA